MVKFANPRHRDRFFASADRIKTITRGLIIIVPDDTAISRLKTKDAKGGSLRFSAARLQVPKLRIQKMGEGGQLNVIPCSRAGGECSAQAPLGTISLDPTPVIAIRRKSRNKEAGSKGVRVGILNIIQKRARASGLRPEHGAPRIRSTAERWESGIYDGGLHKCCKCG